MNMSLFWKPLTFPLGSQVGQACSFASSPGIGSDPGETPRPDLVIHVRRNGFRCFQTEKSRAHHTLAGKTLRWRSPSSPIQAL